eukprot:jgi/Tetstr1/441444/TSEL_029690.t1
MTTAFRPAKSSPSGSSRGRAVATAASRSPASLLSPACTQGYTAAGWRGEAERRQPLVQSPAREVAAAWLSKAGAVLAERHRRQGTRRAGSGTIVGAVVARIAVHRLRFGAS